MGHKAEDAATEKYIIHPPHFTLPPGQEVLIKVS